MYQERNLPSNYLTRVRHQERVGTHKMFVNYMSNPDWSESLVDETVISAEDLLLQIESKELILELLDTLKERERNIIFRHILSDDGIVLEDLGKEYGLTRERVRQIEKSALLKLRRRTTRKAFPKKVQTINGRRKEGNGKG